MRWVRRVLSPYSVNSLALACLPAALEDTAYLDWYVGEVLAARSEFEAALDAAGVRRWPSRRILFWSEIGARHAEFVRLMRARACWCATARAIRAATEACASPSERANR
jgi:histidinol-phosphate aminotransferase